eukprot:3798794-Prymnesium_polylepis.1
MGGGGADADHRGVPVRVHEAGGRRGPHSVVWRELRARGTDGVRAGAAARRVPNPRMEWGRETTMPGVGQRQHHAPGVGGGERRGERVARRRTPASVAASL